jgi:hypothetical protein
MTEVRTRADQPSSMAERIARRLRPSNDTDHADVVTTHGTGPTRTTSTVHHSRNTDYGSRAPEEPGIDGRKRGIV